MTFELGMTREISDNKTGKVIIVIPDLLWNNNEASILSGSVVIKCQQLTNIAKYTNTPIFNNGAMVRPDELDKPGGTYYNANKGVHGFVYEEDGGNIWIGDDDTN